MAAKVLIEPATGAGVLITQQGVGAAPGYSALDVRRSLWPAQQAGVGKSEAYKVKERGAGANMSVDVATVANGYAVVEGTAMNSQGRYTVPPHKETANLTVEASDATNPRIDRIVLRIYDNFVDASGKNVAELEYLKGTAEAGATLANLKGAPAVPASSLLLSNILVAAKVPSITAANVEDARVWAGSGTSTASTSEPKMLAPGSYSVKTYTKAEAEAGVEPSATRTAFVSLSIGSISIGGVTLATTLGVVPPGQKWKTTSATEASTLIL